MDRETWLAERRKGIGSSDAAAIAGLAPEGWGSALSVYLDKLGQLPERTTEPMRWGTRLEPAIAAAYQEETGVEISQPAPLIVRHPEHSWMLASPDRLAADRIVELKTCSAFHAEQWGEPGTDEVPEHYLVQVQHQLAVTGMDLADVAVLIGGQDFRVYTLFRSEALISRLLEIEAAFWERVQQRQPPEPDWSHPNTPALVDALHAPKGGSVQLHGGDALDLVNVYQELTSEIGDKQEQKAEVRARLSWLMGEAGEGVLADGRRITRKEVTRKSYTVNETTYVDFRIRPAKPARKERSE